MRLNILKLSHLRRPAHARGRAGRGAARRSRRCGARFSPACCGRTSSTRTACRSRAASSELVPQVAAEKVAALAVEARERMKLRHAPLLLVREMARHATHRRLVAETLARVIQRADELSEFVAIYWAGGRQPLSAQVKKGLAAAFTQVRRVRAGQVRPRRRGSSARRAVPVARASGRRGAGCAVEAAGRQRAGHARHLGGCAVGRRPRRSEQARGLGASARRAQARCAGLAAQPAQHAARPA